MRGWLSLRSKPPEIVAQTQTTVVLQSANGDVNQFTQHRNICCDRGAYMNIRRHETVAENSSSIEKSGQESRSLLDDRNRRLFRPHLREERLYFIGLGARGFKLKVLLAGDPGIVILLGVERYAAKVITGHGGSGIE